MPQGRQAARPVGSKVGAGLGSPGIAMGIPVGPTIGPIATADAAFAAATDAGRRLTPWVLRFSRLLRLLMIGPSKQ